MTRRTNPKFRIYERFTNHDPSKASLYGEDLCLSASNFPNTNDDTKIHGSKDEENTCKDTIQLLVKGTEKHTLPTTHMAITLSNKYFYEHPNDKLTLSLSTLTRGDLEEKLSMIQCGVPEDQENQARVFIEIFFHGSSPNNKISVDTLEKAPWVGSLRTNEKKKDVYSCGAVLIGPRLALTAAHCIQDSVHSDSGFDTTWNTFSVRFEQKESGSFIYVNVKAYVKPKDGFDFKMYKLKI